MCEWSYNIPRIEHTRTHLVFSVFLFCSACACVCLWQLISQRLSEVLQNYTWTNVVCWWGFAVKATWFMREYLDINAPNLNLEIIYRAIYPEMAQHSRRVHCLIWVHVQSFFRLVIEVVIVAIPSRPFTSEKIIEGIFLFSLWIFPKMKNIFIFFLFFTSLIWEWKILHIIGERNTFQKWQIFNKFWEK